MASIINAERELAVHGSDIRHLQDDMDRLMADMEAMKKVLNAISLTLSEAKGGWKMLMLVGGASGTVGALTMQAIHYLAGK